jgi:peptidoglycan/LPS O-acetylase OafA/YrhL
VALPLRKVDRRLGDLSFPIYLQQYTVLVISAAFLPVSYWTVALVFTGALAIAWVSDVLLESPLRMVRDRIRGRSLRLETNGSEVTSLKSAIFLG